MIQIRVHAASKKVERELRNKLKLSHLSRIPLSTPCLLLVFCIVKNLLCLSFLGLTSGSYHPSVFSCSSLFSLILYFLPVKKTNCITFKIKYKQSSPWVDHSPSYQSLLPSLNFSRHSRPLDDFFFTPLPRPSSFIIFNSLRKNFKWFV